MIKIPESSIDTQTTSRLDPSVSAVIDSSQASRARDTATVDGLGTIFTEAVEANSKALGRRQFAVQVNPVEELRSLFDLFGHPAQAPLETIGRNLRYRTLRELGRDNVPVLKVLDSASLDNAVLKAVEGDPAKASVLLQYVITEAAREGVGAEEAQARAALARLEIRFKPQIQAALNTAQALAKGCPDPLVRQAVRNLYYSSVVARQSLAAIMKSLLGLYGGDAFEQGLSAMRGALADDIAKNSSPLIRAKLNTLLSGLNDCGKLGCVLAECKTLIAALILLRPELNQNAVELLQRFLEYAAMGIAVPEVERLGQDFGGADAIKQLLALQAIFPHVKALPLAWWRDSRSRDEGLENFKRVLVEYATLERGTVHGNTWPGLQA